MSFALYVHVGSAYDYVVARSICGASKPAAPGSVFGDTPSLFCFILREIRNSCAFTRKAETPRPSSVAISAVGHFPAIRRSLARSSADQCLRSISPSTLAPKVKSGKLGRFPTGASAPGSYVASLAEATGTLAQMHYHGHFAKTTAPEMQSAGVLRRLFTGPVAATTPTTAVALLAHALTC